MSAEGCEGSGSPPNVFQNKNQAVDSDYVKDRKDDRLRRSDFDPGTDLSDQHGADRGQQGYPLNNDHRSQEIAERLSPNHQDSGD